MGKRSAPPPDPNIGISALRSAELGEEYLSWMRDQAAISNEWAAEDRGRYQSTFIPLQDQFIAEAQTFDTPEAQAAAARQASTDVQQQAAMATQASERGMARMGVDPRSGRAGATRQRMSMDTGLAAAGAQNSARRTVQATGRSLRAAAVDLGSGMAVNPATSLGMAGNTMSSGFNGAQQGQAGMRDGLNTQWSQQMSGVEMANQQSSDLWGGIGNAMGTFMFSSKALKHDKKPVRRSLLAEMRKMPVEDWTYNKGVADGGRHTGPYAEDFRDATGKGDGKTINMIDAIGTTMGAIQELDRKVEKLARRAMPTPQRTAA